MMIQKVKKKVNTEVVLFLLQLRLLLVRDKKVIGMIIAKGIVTEEIANVQEPDLAVGNAQDATVGQGQEAGAATTHGEITEKSVNEREMRTETEIVVIEAGNVLGIGMTFIEKTIGTVTEVAAAIVKNEEKAKLKEENVNQKKIARETLVIEKNQAKRRKVTNLSIQKLQKQMHCVKN